MPAWWKWIEENLLGVPPASESDGSASSGSQDVEHQPVIESKTKKLPDMKQLPIIDWNSCKVRISLSPRDEVVRKQEQELLNLLKRQYFYFYFRGRHQQSSSQLSSQRPENTLGIPLKQLIPPSFIKEVQPATHFIWTMTTLAGDTVSVPFSFHHLDDPFPVADLRHLENMAKWPDVTVTLVWSDEEKHPSVDRTKFFKPFLWNTFAPGYAHSTGFRPHAWTWLFTSFAKGDKECLLRIEQGDNVWYMVLAEPCAGPWLKKPSLG